jgi:Zn2+/Cd2+-exporting ATPase
MKEKKYRLSELSCANCASKIEHKIGQLPNVEEASLNYLTNELKLKVHKETNFPEFQTIEKIVRDIEGNVDLCEIKPQNHSVFNYRIKGIDCADCASKIERKLNKVDGFENVELNFVAEKLNIITNINQDQDQVLNRIQTMIDQVEPGVTVETIDSNEYNHSHGGETSSMKIIQLFIGALFFITGFIWKEYAIPFYVISYLIIGGEIVWRAIRNILKGHVFDENFLMTLATIGAFAIEQYPEAVAVMLFYQVGEFFQDLAVNRSRRSIKSLMSIRPDVATVFREDDYKILPVEQVGIDEIIQIKPGERVPLDGVILEGESALDTKALTGESLPLNVTIGEQVLSGCININGLLKVRVTKIASESTVAKVLELVENATSKKAPTENFITKFARVYTPIVTIAALLLAVIPPLFFGGEFNDWLYRSFIFLVISCPCALVISVPLGFFGGIGSASKQGILVKGGNYIEALNDIEIAVFDKTGTLTEGSFVVSEIVPIGNITKEELLEKAAIVESFSNHPIAVSLLKAYQKEVDQDRVNNFKEISGHGVEALLDGEKVIVGNARLLNKEQIMFQPSHSIGSILYVAINDSYIGHIVVSDRVKHDSFEAIRQLKLLGIKKTVMLTGDKKEVANQVGQEIGIDQVEFELLPEDKLNQVELLIKEKSSKGKLIFVGDGINDTPVLARADIGIAMGGLGADAAIDVADVVIMTDEPSKVVSAVKIARKTRQIVWQNIIFALGVKLIVLVLGAFNIATMWEAVFADVGVSLIAILNAMRVLKYRI